MASGYTPIGNLDLPSVPSENSSMRIILFAGFAAACLFQAEAAPSIPADTRIYVEAESGLGSYLPAALKKEQVPALVTTDKARADFAVESGSRLIDLKNGDVIFSKAIEGEASRQVLQHTAEACARHLAGILKPPSNHRNLLKTTRKELHSLIAKDPALDF
jgi:hypothetical protein